MPYVTSWERLAEKKGVEIGKKEGVKIGEEIGVKIGEERGEELGRLNAAREMLKMHLDINVIARATGFSVEQILTLTETDN